MTQCKKNAFEEDNVTPLSLILAAFEELEELPTRDNPLPYPEWPLPKMYLYLAIKSLQAGTGLNEICLSEVKFQNDSARHDIKKPPKRVAENS